MMAPKAQAAESMPFPFTRLPYELRRIIWDLALPKRIIDLGCFIDISDQRVPFLHPSHGYFQDPSREAGLLQKSTLPPLRGVDPPVPRIASVCRESRTIAYETGRLVPVKADKFAGRPQRGGKPRPEPKYVWFDPARDSICLSSTALQTPGLGLERPRGDGYHPHSGVPYASLLLCDQSWWPHLKEITRLAREISVPYQRAPVGMGRRTRPVYAGKQKAVTNLFRILQDGTLWNADMARRQKVDIIIGLTRRHFNHVDTHVPLVRDFAESGGVVVSVDDFDGFRAFAQTYLLPPGPGKKGRRKKSRTSDVGFVEGRTDGQVERFLDMYCSDRDKHASYLGGFAEEMQMLWHREAHWKTEGMEPTRPERFFDDILCTTGATEKASGRVCKAMEALPFPEMRFVFLTKVCMHNEFDATVPWEHTFQYLRR